MALAASFRDRDGDTEKEKQKGSERGKARQDKGQLFAGIKWGTSSCP